MKPLTKDLFTDVRFSLNERKDHQWDLVVFNKSGGKVVTLGPLSWDDVVRECNKCQRLRFDFLEQLKGEQK